MILGLSSYTFGWSIGVAGSMPHHPMTERGLIDRVVDSGMKCLQIGDNLPLHTFSAERLGKLKRRTIDEGIRLEVGARRMTEKNLVRYLDICSFLEAPMLRFVVDDAGYAPDTGTIVSIIKNCLEELKKRKIRLGIENHDRLSAAKLAHIMDSVGDTCVGICLDCVNSLGAGEGLDTVAHLLGPYTINLHIKDYTIQRLPHKMGFIVQGCPAGNGMTDIPRLYKLLASFGRCESAVLEQWVVPEASIEETISKEQAWAMEGIHYLKGLGLFELKN